MRVLGRLARAIARSLTGGPQSSIDGKLTTADIRVALFAMIAMAISLAVAGSALELILMSLAFSSGPYSWRGLTLGFSLGAFLGAIGAFVRIALDLAYRPSSKSPSASVSYDLPPEGEEPPAPQVAPVTKGVKVWVEDKRVKRGQILRGHLLPNLERIQAARTLRRVARGIIGRGENFSKRQAASYLPEDDRNPTRDELLRLGILIKAGPAPNSGYNVTELGLGFFELCLEEPFPPDPLTLYIE